MQREWTLSLSRKDQTISLMARKFVEPNLWRTVEWNRNSAADEIASKLRELAAAIEDADNENKAN